MDESQRGVWPADLVRLVRQTGRLCLNLGDPGWDDYRGYLFHDQPMTLYFPVAKRYMPDDPKRCQVLVMSKPRVLLTGELQPATSQDDTALQLALAQRSGMSVEDTELMLLDQRTRKARRTRFKLLVHHLEPMPG